MISLGDKPTNKLIAFHKTCVFKCELFCRGVHALELTHASRKLHAKDASNLTRVVCFALAMK